MHLQIAHIVPDTKAEGPGRRFAVWFQGCPLRCPGCCNPELLPFTGGQTLELQDILTQLDDAVHKGVEGISLLGGEPFAHVSSALAIATAARQRNLSVMIYTGYTLSQLLEMNNDAVHRLLATTDIVVDGPYLREQPETKRRWIGSANQRVHFLSDRHRADDACWKKPNTLELRLADGAITMNGFPAPQAKMLWQRVARS